MIGCLKKQIQTLKRDTVHCNDFEQKTRFKNRLLILKCTPETNLQAT